MGLEELTFQLPTGPSVHTIISTTDTLKQPALVFLHFWGGSNRTFHAVIDEVKPRYNIVAPSLRGWGKSTSPDYNDATDYSIVNQSKDIASLLEILKVSKPEVVENGVILCGHSMGGKIAQLLLAEPRIQDLIQALILIAPAPSGGFRLEDDMREQQIHAYESLESAKFVLKNVLLSQSSTLSADEINEVVTDMVRGSKGAKEAWPLHGMSDDHEKSVIAAVDDFKGLKNEVVPVLVIVGADDLIEKPPNVKSRVADLLEEAGAEVQWSQLEKVGHMIPLEAPSALAQCIVKFVDKLKTTT